MIHYHDPLKQNYTIPHYKQTFCYERHEQFTLQTKIRNVTNKLEE